jgi:hypothetical protein
MASGHGLITVGTAASLHRLQLVASVAVKVALVVLVVLLVIGLLVAFIFTPAGHRVWTGPDLLDRAHPGPPTS